MAGNDLKFARIAVAFDTVKVAVALGFGKRQRAGGDEIFHGNAVRVEGDAAAFGLRDAEKVSANAGKADGLRRRGARIRRRHFSGGVIENAQSNG